MFNNDIIHSATKFIDHNRYTFAAIFIVAFLCLYMIGCSVTTASPVTGEQKTESELIVEAEQILASYDTQIMEYENAIEILQKEIETTGVVYGYAFDELEAKQQAINESLQVLTGVISEATSPATGGVISTVIGVGGMLFGISAVADNRRKDSIIKRNKQGAT